jgi:hypothetical protein
VNQYFAPALVVDGVRPVIDLPRLDLSHVTVPVSVSRSLVADAINGLGLTLGTIGVAFLLLGIFAVALMARETRGDS